MDLYLVRHAIAESRDSEQWPDDSRRPLSAKGAELFRLASRGVRRLGIGVDAVLTSSYLRASQTAALLAEEADWPDAETCPALEPVVPVSEIVPLLEVRTESSLALVGHQPELGELASLLLAANQGALGLEFRKGGVMCLRFGERLVTGGATLRWSATPKMLRLIGR